MDKTLNQKYSLWIFIGILSLITIILALFKVVKFNEGNTIPIIQTAEHLALNSTREGIAYELKICCNQAIHFEIVHGDLNLASLVTEKFKQDNPKVIVAIGTMASQAAMQKLRRDQYLVFASVTDPSQAGLTRNSETDSNGNYYITGVSNFISSKDQITFMKEIIPSIQRIGVIYNPGEPNSIVLMAELSAAAKDLGIDVVFAPINSTNDVTLSAQNMIQKKIDAFFINNDNTALSAINSIVKIGEKAQKPVFASDTDTLKDGVLAAYGTNQYELGIQAGQLVCDILNNTKNSNPKQVIFPKKIERHINLEMAKHLNIKISEEIIQKADFILN